MDSDILIYQVPGGMLSNFRTQLKEQGMSDKFDQVVKEIPVVREALGWIPLVTPTSQIVGTQAMMNVKFGRWKMICQPAQDIALGKYGRTPGPIDANVLAQVEKQTGKKVVTERPANLLPPAMETYRKQCAEKSLPTDDETSSFMQCSRSRSRTCTRPRQPGPLRPQRLLPRPRPLQRRRPWRPTTAPAASSSSLSRRLRHDVTVETLEG